MINTGKVLALLALSAAALNLSATTLIKPTGVEHMTEARRLPDGTFEVTCMDGSRETRSAEDMSRNRVCTHITSSNRIWKLAAGGSADGFRMCDLKVATIATAAAILSGHVEFTAPCSGPAGDLMCTGLVCSAAMGSTTYEFTFSQTQLRVARTSDGLAGIYTPTGSAVVNGNLRLATVDGVDGILQATDGNEWLSVCDDGFTMAAAEVACREMGFRGVQSLQTSVAAPNDVRYGVDDLACAGMENSLLDCSRSAWGIHNCTPYEHVQLVCN